ncbi:hypothetical protein D9M69_423360 [compost metagenome]
MVVAAQQVVEHAFAQGTLGMGHAREIEGLEDGFGNRQAGRENRAAIRLDAVQVDLVHIAQLEQLAFEPGQAFRVDLAVAQARGLDRQAYGADGAGGAHRFLPAEAAQAVLDAHQFQARGGVGLGVARRGDLAVAEIALGVADATHLQAFAQLRLEALADDEFGAAAADVRHQAAAGGVRQGVGNTQVDQARFLAAGDDLHRVAEDFFGAVDELGAVVGFAQGVGADDAHGAFRQAGDHLGEAAQAIQAALHGFLAEVAGLVQACRQLNLVAEPFQDTDLAMVGLGHHHVEAVRAEVDGGDQGRDFGRLLRHGFGSRG